jgi:hypothetical protein
MAERVSGPYRGFYISASARRLAATGRTTEAQQEPADDDPGFVGSVSLAQGGPDDVHRFEALVDLGENMRFRSEEEALVHVEASARAYIDRLMLASWFARCALYPESIFMRQFNLRHAVLHDIAHCVLDLFPSDADMSEVGPDDAPALFVSWRTSGVANHPGNVAWGVHYRLDAPLLRGYPSLDDAARARVCERVRDMTRHLWFDYADPHAVSLLVVDVAEAVARPHGAWAVVSALDRTLARRVP